METDPKGLGALFEGKVIIDKTYGSVTYGCFICCGPTDTQHEPYSPSIGVSSQLSGDITGTNSCGGGTDYITSYYDTWWTDNSGIVSVPSWATWRGNSAGTTTGYASGMIARSDGEAVARPSMCFTQYDQPTTPTNVMPTISGPNTVWWFNGFDPDPDHLPTQITLSASGGTVTSWNVVSGSSLISLSSSGNSATITGTGTGSSTVGDVQITVTANGQTSPVFQITSRFPAYLSSVKVPWDCSYRDSTTGIQGWWDDYTYTLKDNLNEAVGWSPGVNEVWSGSTVWPHGATNGSVSGGFVDTIKVCATAGGLSPMPLPPQDPPSGYLVDSPNQKWCAGYSFANIWGYPTCNGIQVQNKTANRYRDRVELTSP